MNQKVNTIHTIKEIKGIDLLCEVDHSGKKVIDWAKDNQMFVEEWLQNQGALLLRGLNVTSSKQFGKILSVLFNADLLSYEHRSTPRTELRGNIYTTTEYHSDQLIVQHNEQAYTNAWPMRIGFFCMLPSETGGETPIADSRNIYKLVPDDIKKKFEEKGIRYVRNYSDIDLPWTEVYNTESRQEVEAFCRNNNIQYQWKENGNLRTEQTLPATAIHPATGEKLWFNQAHLFHSSTLGKEILEALYLSVDKNDLPRNTYYGDGSEIEDDVIETIKTIYQENKISFPWEKGDIMLLDNMLYSHGREPFTGERRVLAGMANPHSV